MPPIFWPEPHSVLKTHINTHHIAILTNQDDHLGAPRPTVSESHNLQKENIACIYRPVENVDVTGNRSVALNEIFCF